jgi:hypothetical protein
MSLSNDTPEKLPLEAHTDTSYDDHEVRGDVVPASHVHLSVGDMLKGTGAHDMTPFERKAALINA